MSISNVGSSGAVRDLAALREKLAERLKKEADADGDGKISKAELQAAAESHAPKGAKADTAKVEADFKAADADANGSLDGAEVDALAGALMERAPKGAKAGGPGGPPPGGPSGPPPGGPGGAPPGGPPPGAASESEASTSDPADTNGDGEVSEAERIAYESKQVQAYRDTMETTDVASATLDVKA